MFSFLLRLWSTLWCPNLGGFIRKCVAPISSQILESAQWVSMLKTPMCRERLEIFAPPPYRRRHDPDNFRFPFAALVPLS
jgi:hypothetical protein